MVREQVIGQRAYGVLGVAQLLPRTCLYLLVVCRITSIASSPVNCSSSTSASSCCSSQLLDEAAGATEGACGAASAPSRPIGLPNTWASAAGSKSGAAGSAVGGAAGGAVGGAADHVAVFRGAAVFPGAGVRSSKEELYIEEVEPLSDSVEDVGCASASCEKRLLRSANAATHTKPAGRPAGAATGTTAAEPRKAGGIGSVAECGR